MYVRVYVCVRTWGRSAAETRRHRLAVFTQRGRFLLRDFRLLLVLSAAGFGLLRAASVPASFAPGAFALASEHHARIEPNRCVRLSQMAVRSDSASQITKRCTRTRV